jgi:hypothetical protein
MNSSVPSTKVSDFLKKEVPTPFHQFFLACGITWEISTNSRSILKAAQEAFISLARPRAAGLRLGLRLWVDSEESSGREWPKPYVRGLDHLVFASFDAGSSMLIDASSAGSQKVWARTVPIGKP